MSVYKAVKMQCNTYFPFENILPWMDGNVSPHIIPSVKIIGGDAGNLLT